MIRRMFAILVFAAVCTQVLLGGFGTGISLCFGGEIEHTHECDGHTHTHTHTCEHDGSVFPTPVLPDDTHSEDCPCNDVEIELSDLIVTQRDAALALPAPEFTPHPVAPLAQLETDPPAWRPPPWDQTGSHRLASTLAVVRATRLLI